MMIAGVVRQVSRILVLVAGLAGIGWMVYESFDPGEHYLFYHPDWTYSGTAVAVIAFAMAAETGIAYWVLGSVDRLRRRTLTALVGFLPLWMVAAALSNRSAPSFYYIHTGWVSLLLAFFVMVSVAHGSLYLFRRLGRRRDSSPEVTVEQTDAPDNTQDR